MTDAADVLRALLGNGDPHIRHKAAVKMLELGLKVTEVAELKSRVARLEQTPTEITVRTDSTKRLSFQELKQIARQALAEMGGATPNSGETSLGQDTRATAGGTGAGCEPSPSLGTE
jgi:hypothetical protein